jgi:hypothetical protein
MAQFGFEINTETEAAGFFSGTEILPAGWYTFRITNEEWADVRNNGKQLVLSFSTDKGQTVKKRLNLVNNSAQAVAIARSELAKIALVIGHKGPLTGTDILFGKPFDARIDVEEYQGQDKDGNAVTREKNEVKEYRPTMAAAPKPASGDSNPW